MIKNKLNHKKNCLGQAAAELAIFATLIILCFSALLMYGQRLEEQQRVKMEAFRKALQKAYERNSSVSYTLQRDTRFYNLMAGFGEGEASSLSATANVMWQKGASGKQGDKDKMDYAYYQINDEILGSFDNHTADTILPLYQKTTTGLDGKDSNVFSPVSIWKTEAVKQAQYGSLTRKQEDKSGSIINTKASDLQDKITNKIYVRFDKAKTDARQAVTNPEYVYENEYYDFEGDSVQINAPDNNTAIQGAYINTDNTDIKPDDKGTYSNRIGYSQDKAGENIHKERTWVTPY